MERDSTSPIAELLMKTAALVIMWLVSWPEIVMTGATITGVVDCSVNTAPGPHTTTGGLSTTVMVVIMLLLVCRPSNTWKEIFRTPGVGLIALSV